ncbi:hypothetical protein MNB_SUP05-SYMBIONT-5-283 [hydrothermal vent metagenome]|uniref:Uncharacterized protein n=1 Tax=hydrothermal vent metagenome TaxID=652676 RepID=A0A1W1E0B1_9ZZZZ
MIFLNPVLAELRQGLKNCQVGKKWIFDAYSYLCKGLNINSVHPVFFVFATHIFPFYHLI